MRIYRCSRCDGCGYIAGGFRWETPWTRCVPAEGAQESLLEALACPDCGGTGALIELDAAAAPPRLPTRRGVRLGDGYPEHVSRVLRQQALQRD